MHPRFEGKAALVTGAATGTGQATAVRLAAEASYVTSATLLVDGGFIVNAEL